MLWFPIINGEFKLIIIISDDNQISHAVCIDNKYIFDSNSPKCLPMTKEGINCCCGKNNYFVGIKYRYYFQFQPMKHNYSKKNYSTCLPKLSRFLIINKFQNYSIYCDII